MKVRRDAPVRRRARATRGAARVAPPDGYDRILAVAVRWFSEVGYEGTTTAGVARDAGTTQPLIHHHFGSKHGLWEAAMDTLFSAVPKLTASAAASPVDRIVEGVELVVRFVATRPQVTRVIAREGATQSPRLTYLIERYLRAPMTEVMTAVREGQRNGSITPTLRPELLLFFVLGAGSHLFDVTAFAKESAGIDTTTAATREAFVTLIGTVLRAGIFTATTGRSAPRARRG